MTYSPKLNQFARVERRQEQLNVVTQSGVKLKLKQKVKNRLAWRRQYTETCVELTIQIKKMDDSHTKGSPACTPNPHTDQIQSHLGIPFMNKTKCGCYMCAVLVSISCNSSIVCGNHKELLSRRWRNYICASHRHTKLYHLSLAHIAQFPCGGEL